MYQNAQLFGNNWMFNIMHVYVLLLSNARETEDEDFIYQLFNRRVVLLGIVQTLFVHFVLFYMPY